MVRYRGYRFEAEGRRQEAGGRRGMYFIILKKVICYLPLILLKPNLYNFDSN
jgi:hypothetical protein